MIEQVQLFFKDPAKVAKAATVAFFLFVAMSIWFLFTLRYDLVYEGGMIDSNRANGVIAKLAVMVGLAFAFCYAMIFFTQRAKKETIVYLDKKIESTEVQQATFGQANDNLNLNALRQKLKSAEGKDNLQSGFNELCSQLNAGQGALYTVTKKGESKTLDLKSGYALVLGEQEQNPSFQWGEGLIGQVAASGKAEYLDEMPEGYAARVESGLGGALPKFLFIFPIQRENETVGVVEVATFTNLSESVRKQAVEAGNILSAIS